jgi:hypothetical protein
VLSEVSGCKGKARSAVGRSLWVQPERCAARGRGRVGLSRSLSLAVAICKLVVTTDKPVGCENAAER